MGNNLHRTITILFLAALLPIMAFAQLASPPDEISALDGFVPVGARSAALGGAGIAIAQDWSAAYYNPAQLGYVYRSEVSGVLNILSGSSKSTFNGSPEHQTDFTAAKLNNLGMVFSFPAKKGGLAMACGYYRPQSFDRDIYFSGTRQDGISIRADENYDGGLGSFYVAVGGQATPNVAFGATVEFVAGAENYSWQSVLGNFDDTLVLDSVFSDHITRDYSGVTGKVGISVKPAKFLTWGATIAFPTALAIEEQLVQKTTVHYNDGGNPSFVQDGPFDDHVELTTPFSFGTGLAFTSTYVNLTGDVQFTDWRHTSFDEPLYYVEQNNGIDEYYRATLRFAGGAEFSLPFATLPMRLRAGYRFDPVPYKSIAPYESIEEKNERQYFTGGVAFLIEKSFLLESSVVFSNVERTSITSSNNRIGEKYSLSNIFIGLTYRF